MIYIWEMDGKRLLNEGANRLLAKINYEYFNDSKDYKQFNILTIVQNDE